MHTIALEENMPFVDECIKSLDVHYYNEKIGMGQIIFDHTYKGKIEGFTTYMQSQTVDFPVMMVTCIQAARLDKAKIENMWNRVTAGPDAVFWNHLDTWATAHADIKGYRDEHLYGKAGYAFAHTLVEVTSDSARNGHILPDILPDILPPIVIPEPLVIAADLFAGLLYGITQREGLPNLGECLYGADELVYDLLHAYNDVASQTFAGIMNGLILLAMTVMYIPNDLYECALAKEDAKAFEEWLGSIVHERTELIATIRYNLTHHFAALSIELNKARKDLTMGYWSHLGEDLGEMLVIATKPMPAETSAWLDVKVYH